jgi:hypothetical protein
LKWGLGLNPASYKKLSLIQKANTLLLETRREETQEGVG